MKHGEIHVWCAGRCDWKATSSRRRATYETAGSPKYIGAWPACHASGERELSCSMERYMLHMRRRALVHGRLEWDKCKAL